MRFICFLIAGFLAICSFDAFMLSRRFWPSRSPLGKAVAIINAAICVCMAGTFCFAVFEYLEWFPDPVDWRVSSVLRIAMGSTVLLAMRNLNKRTDEVILDYELERDDGDTR